MDSDQLYQWLEAQNFPADVIESFRDNEMDGESLEALLGTTQGPDCLKELIPKVGIRLKVYQRIRTAMYNRCQIFSSDTPDQYGGQQDVDDPGCVTDSSYKESTPSTGGSYSSATEQEISRLRKQVSSLCKEKQTLQSELECLDREKEQAMISTSSKSADLPSTSKSVDLPTKKGKIIKLNKGLPDPFPIPTFRHSTEVHLKKSAFQENDRMYMVQTLATILMTYKSRPSLPDCRVVSQALHKKFKCLGDESSEGAWTWFIYTRTQNVNRPDKICDDSSPPKKRKRLDSLQKHQYPAIPSSADDEVSNNINLELLQQEWEKTKTDPQKLKNLLIRTHSVRRTEILNSESVTAQSILQKFPMLKKCSYAKLEFELTMQRPNLKNEFDEELVLWTKAVVKYCKRACTRSTAIQKIVKNVDVDCDDQLLMKAMRCLGLLLIPGKTKEVTGDIPFFVKFVPNETPIAEAPEQGNNQPHLVIFNHDEFDQYFISIEQKLCMECADVATAIFHLLGSHYILNLSYHPKLNDLLIFVQEKIAHIPSSHGVRSKSAVATTHINGIASEYEALKSGADHDSDTDDN